MHLIEEARSDPYQLPAQVFEVVRALDAFDVDT